MQLLAVSQQTGLEITIIRPPLVYGAGAKGNLGLLERAVRKGLPLPIGALDFNRRSLVSLTNLVDLIACCVHHPGAANRVFLASDNEDVSTLGLAQVIAQACSVRLRTLAVPVSLLTVAASVLGRRDMLRRLTDSLQVDISATCVQLNWQPVQSVEQAMTEAFATGTRRAQALSR
ncbi:MAG TPA: NAD-dependent dehydratase, partial [Orrella sp.]